METVDSRVTSVSSERYDYLCKVIVIGGSGTGKSCILQRFIRNAVDLKLNTQTIGVEFCSKVVQVQQTVVKLQLWDTAGSERFRALTRSYYRGTAGVVLVYDVTNIDSLLVLKEFIEDCLALTEHPSFILCGNKIDLIDSTDPTLVIPSKEIEKFILSVESNYNIKISHIRASALTGENVSSIFENLVESILTKIEIDEIDIENPKYGIQFGDIPNWNTLGSLPSALQKLRRTSEAIKLSEESSSGTNSSYCQC